MGEFVVVSGPPWFSYGDIRGPLSVNHGRHLIKHLRTTKEKIHVVHTRILPSRTNETPAQGWKLFCQSESRFRDELANALRSSSWILCLGSEAWRAVTGLSRWKEWIGAPYRLDIGETTCSVIPTWSQSFIASKGGIANAEVFEKHVRRYADLATGRLAPWAWCKSYVDNDQRALSALEALMATDEPLGVDIETDPQSNNDITCIGVGTGDVAVSVTYPFESESLGSTILDFLRSPKVKVWQNGAFDLTHLAANRIEVAGPHEDTMLLHSILRPHERHDLGYIASSYTHAPAWKAHHGRESEFDKTIGRFSRVDEEAFRETRLYNSRDCSMQRIIYDALIEEAYGLVTK